MPFTPAHPAAALLLRWTNLPMSALVAGTVAPDAPVYFAGMRGYGFTHSVAGVLTVDPLIALALLVLWFGLVRDTAVGMLPARMRARVPRHAALSGRDWLLAPVAGVLGSGTHVLWDSFTHADRWGVEQVGWLQAEHAGAPGYSWLIWVSGLLGFAAVAIAVWLQFRGPAAIDGRRRSTS